jgi:hypothetical protein
MSDTHDTTPQADKTFLSPAAPCLNCGKPIEPRWPSYCEACDRQILADAIDADTPRLNPPETAPKDGTPILGAFGWMRLQPAVWSKADGTWQTAANCFGESEESETWWETDYELECSIRGWLPWPEVAR